MLPIRQLDLRINVTAAARNIREMALNPDKSTYDDYEQGAKEKLEDVDVQLKTIKKSGIVPENQYNEYSKALSDWANTPDTQSWIRLKPTEG